MQYKTVKDASNIVENSNYLKELQTKKNNE